MERRAGQMRRSAEEQDDGRRPRRRRTTSGVVPQDLLKLDRPFDSPNSFRCLPCAHLSKSPLAWRPGWPFSFRNDEGGGGGGDGGPALQPDGTDAAPI